MSFLPQVYTVPTMVTGASITSSIQLAGNYVYCYLMVPTMTGGYGADTRIMLQGSYDNVTFFRFANPESNTFIAASNDFIIQSGATQRMVYVPSFTAPYVKIETSAVATNGVAAQGQFKLICVSNQ